MTVIYNSVQAFDAELAARPVVRTYRGKQGCACGCRGTYSELPATTTKRLAEMRAAIASGEATQITVEPGVYVGVDTATHLLTAYTGVGMG